MMPPLSVTGNANLKRECARRLISSIGKLYPGLRIFCGGYRLRMSLPLIVGLGLLDKELGLDVFFTLNNGMQLSCQEKLNSHTYRYK